MSNWLSNILKKEKYLSHAEYDTQWKKLTRKEKSIMQLLSVEDK